MRRQHRARRRRRSLERLAAQDAWDDAGVHEDYHRPTDEEGGISYEELGRILESM